MATPFAAELARHVQRSGDLQVDLALKAGVSQPAVTRWFSGLDVPDAWRLHAIALEYHLTPPEFGRLLALGGYARAESEPLTRSYAHLFQARPHELAPSIREAQSLRSAGKPREAINLAAIAATRLQEFVHERIDEDTRSTALSLLTLALDIKLHAHIESTGFESLGDACNPDIAILLDLAAVQRDRVRARVAKESAEMRSLQVRYIVLTRIDSASCDLSAVDALIDDTTNFIDRAQSKRDALTISRGRAICFAIRGEHSRFHSEYREVLQRAKSSWARRLAAGAVLDCYEGRARGELRLGNRQRALTLIDAAVDSIDTLRGNPTFYQCAEVGAHYTRAMSVLEDFRRVHDRRKFAYVEDVLTAAVRVCTRAGHQRRLSEILTCLSRLASGEPRLKKLATSLRQNKRDSATSVATS